MKTPVSLGYLIAIVLLAAAAAALSYTSSGPAANLAALLLGLYALHLVSLRVVLRQYAGAGWSKHVEGVQVADIRSMREELEQERAELDNRKAKLEQRIVAAEEQWALLRQMIRDRVEGGAELPTELVLEPRNARASTPTPAAGRKNGPTEESPRVHGRW